MSPRDPVQALKWQALSVALAAQAGALRELDVQALVALADQLEGVEPASPADRLRRAARHFATLYDVTRRIPEDLAAEGATLMRLIELAAIPDPPGQERADIHG